MMKTYHLRARSKQLLGDLHTPVSIYLKVRDLFAESALLESSDFHGNENSLSYIGIEPIGSFVVENSVARSTFPDGTQTTQDIDARPGALIAAMEGYLKRIRIEGDHCSTNGLLGYTSFEAVEYFDNIRRTTARTSESAIPIMYYNLYRYVIVLNHFKNTLTIVELMSQDEAAAPNSRMAEIEALIESRNFASYNFSTTGPERSPIDDEQYREYVRRGIGHCRRGDVFQIVLSREFSTAFRGEDFKVYRALRSINPSPYLFYFDFGYFRIFGSSPETHCRIKDRHITIDPIAGTFRRTGSAVDDLRLAERLLADPKENAEHVMLVDLARNDLSRNADKVEVEFYKEVQFYSHVIHLVSRVGGTLAPEASPLGAFADTFPAGTLSGAPKIRAVELIGQIERDNRGFYGGCIGFIGLDGDINQAITIRSFMSRDNVLHYRAGAGVVAKSDPEAELQEVYNKIGALRQAIAEAQELKN